MSGAYEYTYAAAPPEVATTSVTTLTALLVTAGVGFLVGSLGSRDEEVPSAPPEREPREDDDTTHSLDDMMEKSQ